MAICLAQPGEFVCSDEQSVGRVAAAFAAHLRPPDTIAFSGDLGAGKTTFIRYLCEALGSTVPVSSPTYVLSFEYPTDRGWLIEHWDLYRVYDEVPELLDRSLPNTLRLIEWAERMQSWDELPPTRISLAFGQTADERIVVIRPLDLAGKVGVSLGFRTEDTAK